MKKRQKALKKAEKQAKKEEEKAEKEEKKRAKKEGKKAENTDDEGKDNIPKDPTGQNVCSRMDKKCWSSTPPCTCVFCNFGHKSMALRNNPLIRQ